MNIPGTEIYSHPSIADLVPGYITPPCALSKRTAIRYIVDSHLRANIARGHGHAAARRAKALKRQGNRYGGRIPIAELIPPTDHVESPRGFQNL